MRWNCPHCGVNLAVSDEKIGSGWSFSRCYKCGGFALIRKAEVNIIKVDKAPVGENVLLPEATEKPVLSHQATQNLEKLLSEKPRAITPPLTDNKTESKTDNKPPAPPRLTPPPPPQQILSQLPDPLPEMPEKPAVFRFLPAAIGLAGVLTISSGIYLYVQGQTLWKTARTNNAKVAPPAAIQQPPPVTVAVNPTPPASTIISDRVTHNMMAPERPKALTIRIRNENAKLRSGPGTKFPIIGTANPQVRYEVLGWKNDWFKVAPVRARGIVANANEFEISAWIRNDLVELLDKMPQPD